MACFLAKPFVDGQAVRPIRDAFSRNWLRNAGLGCHLIPKMGGRTMRLVNHIISAASVITAMPLMAQQADPRPKLAEAYVPFEFLIGDWTARVEASGTTVHERLRWGPGNSYIFYSTYMAADGQPERLHFEGIMVWNGKSKALDYVFAVEPGSGAQEKGTIRAEADGTIVREVELTDASGRTGNFRQTFRKLGLDRIETSVMRQTKQGWEPTFPGSERIEMTRREG